MHCTGAKRKREHANDLIIPRGTRDQLGMGVRRFLGGGIAGAGARRMHRGPRVNV